MISSSHSIYLIIFTKMKVANWKETCCIFRNDESRLTQMFKLKYFFTKYPALSAKMLSKFRQERIEVVKFENNLTCDRFMQ